MILFACFGVAVLLTIVWSSIEKNKEHKSPLSSKDHKLIYRILTSMIILTIAQLVAIKNIEIRHEKDIQNVQTID